ncbi:MAG: hypothetical protein KH347_08090 [Acetobacter sp.]|nr:hypothetical protein [Acetobacter sp.]
MADNTENETTATQNAQTINDAPEAEQENVGEVSDTEQQTPQKEEKGRAEFSPPDLGNEDNVSDWLVNMLSGRLWDFALNNMEWIGDLCDRAFYSRMERNAEKRRMALKVKEAQQRAATASQKKLTNEDGTINAGAAKTRCYDDKGNLVGLDDYALKPGDKVVDAEGKPLQGKTPEEMEAQLRQSRQNVAEKNKSKPLKEAPLSSNDDRNAENDEKEKNKDKDKDKDKNKNKNKNKNREKNKDKKKKKKSKSGNGQTRSDNKNKDTKNNENSPRKKTRTRQKRSPQEAAQEARKTQQAKKERAQQGRIASNKKRNINKNKQKTQSSKNEILNVSRQNQQNRTNSNMRGRNGANRGGRD